MGFSCFYFYFIGVKRKGGGTFCIEFVFLGLEAIILFFLFSCFTKLFGGVKNGGELSCVDLSMSFLTMDVVTVS